MRRLAPGEAGQIDAAPYVREDGKLKRAPSARKAQTWRARCYVCTYDGIRRQVTRWAPTKIAAQKAAEQATKDLIGGRSGKGKLKASSPFGDAVSRWLDGIRRQDAGIKETTRGKYVEAYRRHLEGADLLRMSIESVNAPSVLRGFLRDVADDHGSGSAKHVRVIIGGALSLAVEDRAVDVNALREVKTVGSEGGPKIGKHLDHARALTRSERGALLRYATRQAIDAMRYRRDPRTVRTAWAVADLIALAAATGCRISELLDLRWSDVELRTGAVIVQEGKTEASRRRVDLPAWCLSRLVRRASRMLEDGTFSGTGRVLPSPALLDADAPWYWVGKDGSESLSNVTRKLRAAYDGAGFPWMSTHSLRRTAATLLDAAGASVSEIAGQLGHRNPALTARVYLDRDLRRDKSHLARHL